MILELKLELKRERPVVSRTIHIHPHATFKELHQVIQLMFDWWDTYPYRFYIKRQAKSIIYECDRHHLKSTKEQKARHNTKEPVMLKEYFHPTNKRVIYEYGLKNRTSLTVTLHQIKRSKSMHTKYPICIRAKNERTRQTEQLDDAAELPFGKQRSLQYGSLIDRLNKRIADNIVQFSSAEWNIFNREPIERLQQFTAKYYEAAPWKQINNQQIFAIYDERFDEYLFCSVLGKENDLYGLSVYIGFNGLLSLHTSLTKRLSIEQLFHLHSNLLLQFENKPNEKQHMQTNSSTFITNDVKAHFTSYKPGYYPWKMNERERAMFSLAIEHTLKLYEDVESGFTIPNYIETDQILLIKQYVPGEETRYTYVTLEEMIKKVLPLQLTVSKSQLKSLKQKNKQKHLTVEFSLKYVDVPIQRLKDNRPFLPLSSVIANEKSKQIVYHNIYNSRLNYAIVQAEFMQMINMLGVLPNKILTDELTHHYLEPLLLVETFPIVIKDKLRVSDEINKNISQYLLTKAE